MKNIFLFAFHSHDPHVTIIWGQIPANILNEIGKQVLCIDEALGHSKGVF